MTYSIKEIVYTLQRANAGRPAVFCRLAGLCFRQ
jgi:organic radical activating enzyme